MKIFIISLIFFLKSSSLYGAAWKTTGITIPSEVLTEVRKQIPSIANETQLAKLIDLLSDYYPSANVQANFNGATWDINLVRAQLIVSISVKSSNISINRVVEKITKSYRGGTYDKNNIDKLRDEILNSLDFLGFPNAKVKIIESIKENRVQLNVDIRRGKKCTVQKIELPFTLPTNIDTKGLIGKICNTSEILSFADELENRLKKVGYAFATISFKDIIKTQNSTFGTVIFVGSLGKIINYNFINISDKKKLSFERDFKLELLPTNFSPYSVRSEIIKSLRKAGYNDPFVNDPQVDVSQATQETYIFEFDPREKTTISKITVLGNKLFSEGEILEKFRANLTWGLSKSIDIDELDSGINLLKKSYLMRGYWDVKIREPRFTNDPNTGDTKIILLIDEGLPRKLQDIEISGNNFFSQVQIRDMLSLQSGDSIDKNILLEFEKQLLKRYREAGFIYSDISILISGFNTRRSIPSKLTIKIEEGPRTKFGEIFIFGLERTKKQVVLREITFRSGSTYSPEKVRKLQRRLINTGLFRFVAVEPLDKEVLEKKGQVIDLSINLKEGQAGLISFGPGYDLFQGYNYTAEASYKNLFGKAKKISIRGYFSQDKRQEAVKNYTLLGSILGLGYTEPYFLGVPLEGRLSLSHRAKATNFWKFSTISSQETSYNFDSTRSNSLTIYTKQKINIEVGSEAQKALFLTQGDTQINSIGSKVHLDTRNDKSWPTSGTFLSLDLEKAGYLLNGNTKFDKIGFTNNNYLGISNSIVLALSLSYTKFSSVDRNNTNYGQNTIPTSEALFAGGPDMVRGFNEQLGPYIRYFSKDENGNENIKEEEIIGGTVRFIGKLEFRYLLNRNWALNIFYDTGNSFLEQSEVKKINYRLTNQNETESIPTLEDNFMLDFAKSIENPNYYLNKVYTSTGLSINILTPLGSFRFGYAFPIKVPRSSKCAADSSFCLERRPIGDRIFDKGKLDISIATTF